MVTGDCFTEETNQEEVLMSDKISWFDNGYYFGPRREDVKLGWVRDLHASNGRHLGTLEDLTAVFAADLIESLMRFRKTVLQAGKDYYGAAL